MRRRDEDVVGREGEEWFVGGSVSVSWESEGDGEKVVVVVVVVVVWEEDVRLEVGLVWVLPSRVDDDETDPSATDSDIATGG